MQLHKSTVSELYHRFRVTCEEIVESKLEPWGGLSEEGESIIVEIDKSKFFLKKCYLWLEKNIGKENY